MFYLTAAYMNFFDRVAIAPNAIAIEHNDEKLLTYNCKSQSNGTLFLVPRFTSQRNCYGFIRSVILLPLFLLFYSGACYVPIDNNYPDARLNLIIEDAAAKIHIGNTFNNVQDNFFYLLLISETIESAKRAFKHKSTSSSSLHHLHWDLQENQSVQVAHRINLFFNGKEPVHRHRQNIFSNEYFI
jgi:non-ribosomal peptide synthetase component F